MRKVDKKKFSAACGRLLESETTPKNVWHQKLDFEQPVVSSINIQDLGKVPVPICEDDVRKIKHLCQSSQYYGLEALNKSVGSKQNLEINGSQVTIENTLPSYLASLVTKNLLNHKEVNKECDFEMNLEKLVLYQAGGSFKSHRSDRNESRIIAKAILVIPVDGGHKGGRLNVYSDYSSHKSPSISIERDSGELHFSLTSYYADCRYEMQPITEGSLITLEFKLISTKPLPWSLPVSFPLPSLFAALAELNESLSSWVEWTPQSRNKENADGTTGAFTTSSFSFGKPADYSKPLIVIKNEDDNVIEEEDEEKDPRTRPALEAQPDEMLVIPLRNDYEEESLSFGKLSQPDLILSELLQSIKFVDVHLAIVSQCITGPNHHNFEVESGSRQDHKERSFWVRKWIGSSSSIPHSAQFPLEIKSQLVGGIHKLLRRKLNYDQNRNEYYSVYYHAALVIQPRHQSVYLGCYYSFDVVLTHLSSTASSNDASHRNLSVATLGQVLSFCRQEPCRVWTAPFGLRLRRLVDLCTRLGAYKEGLELLAILGTDFDLDPQNGFIIPNWSGKQPKLANEEAIDVKAPKITTGSSSMFLTVPGSASAMRHLGHSVRRSSIKLMPRREAQFTPGVNRNINSPMMQSSRLSISTPSATPFGSGSQRGRRPIKPSSLARISDPGCVLSPIVTSHVLKAQSSPIKQSQLAKISSPHSASDEETELYQMEETCNEQYWDNYMDGYANETYYSEDPQDEENARRLLEFGEDYRNHLDSFADYPSILCSSDSRQPNPPSKISPFKPSGAFKMTDLSPDSDADVDYLVHIVESSASQFAIALDTFHQMRSKQEPSQSYAELLSTCRSNAHSLQAILFHVKQSECSSNSCGSSSLNELNPIQDLIVKWDQLDTEISQLHKQGLQHQLLQHIFSVRKKFIELETIILVLNVGGEIHANLNKIQNVKEQLKAEKESLWLANYDVHLHLAQQPYTAIILMEDVASLYQMWEQLVSKVLAIDTLLQDAKKTLKKYQDQLVNLKGEMSAQHKRIRAKSFLDSNTSPLEVTLESLISSEWMENWNNLQLIAIIFGFLLSFWMIKALFL